MWGATVASCAEGGPKQHRSETVSHSKSVSTPSATLSSVGAAASGSGGTPVEARGPNPRQKLFQLGGGLTAAPGGWPSLARFLFVRRRGAASLGFLAWSVVTSSPTWLSTAELSRAGSCLATSSQAVEGFPLFASQTGSCWSRRLADRSRQSADWP
jgi:hypothetical protein